jgi:hypothetical protein
MASKVPKHSINHHNSKFDSNLISFIAIDSPKDIREKILGSKLVGIWINKTLGIIKK